MKRLFIASKIELSEPMLELKRQLHYDLQFNDMVWVQEQVTHLTLRFIGKTPEQKVAPLKEALREVCQKHSAFEMSLDKTGCFGSKYKPEVLWYGFQDFTGFRELFELLEPRILDLEFESYRGNFVPHITLARIKKVIDKKKFWQIIDSHPIETPQKIAIKSLILYQSFLHSDGPEYKVLAEYPLGE